MAEVKEATECCDFDACRVNRTNGRRSSRAACTGVYDGGWPKVKEVTSAAVIVACRTDCTDGRRSITMACTRQARVVVARTAPARRSAMEEELWPERPPALSSLPSFMHCSCRLTISRLTATEVWRTGSGSSGTTNLVVGSDGSITAVADDGTGRKRAGPATFGGERTWFDVGTLAQLSICTST